MGNPPSIHAEPSGSTSRTLLERVRERDTAAWERLVMLYGPIVHRWARAANLQQSDADDVTQEVFRKLAEHIDSFRRDRPGDSFRKWLKTITQNQVRDLYRQRAAQANPRADLDQQPEPPTIPDDSAEVVWWELSRRALDYVQVEFTPRTWRAFWLTTIDSRPPADVAEELGISVASVYQARSRVLRRLRVELTDLID